MKKCPECGGKGANNFRKAYTGSIFYTVFADGSCRALQKPDSIDFDYRHYTCKTCDATFDSWEDIPDAE